MTKNRFIFLRATTYFRWARKIAAWCPEVMDAPKVLRRIAGDSRKIELGDNAGIHLRLLQAMGFDLAAIHAASPRSAAAIGADLDKRPRGWLNAAGEAAAIEVRRDFREWKKAFRERS